MRKTVFIKSPNLPERDVALAAMSHTYPNLIQALEENHVEVIPVFPIPSLPKEVSDHADMHCHHLGENRIVVTREDGALKSLLEKHMFTVIPDKSSYSKCNFEEVKLNAARLGSRLFAGKRHLDPAIGDYCKASEITVVSVKQEYSKCSIAIVDENSIITSDPGIAEAAQKENVHVLMIRPGGIRLPGYDYGFIGGCCGLIGPKKIAFTGNPNFHPDGEKMIRFITERKIAIITLGSGELVDVGSILPLKEFAE